MHSVTAGEGPRPAQMSSATIKLYSGPRKGQGTVFDDVKTSQTYHIPFCLVNFFHNLIQCSLMCFSQVCLQVHIHRSGTRTRVGGPSTECDVVENSDLVMEFLLKNPNPIGLPIKVIINAKCHYDLYPPLILLHAIS